MIVYSLDSLGEGYSSRSVCRFVCFSVYSGSRR